MDGMHGNGMLWHIGRQTGSSQTNHNNASGTPEGIESKSRGELDVFCLDSK
jgi:hypothetical protein